MPGEWIMKMCSTDTVGCYSAVRTTGVTSFAGKQVELKKMTVNEATWTQRDKYHIFPLTEGS